MRTTSVTRGVLGVQSSRGNQSKSRLSVGYEMFLSGMSPEEAQRRVLSNIYFHYIVVYFLNLKTDASFSLG